MFKPGYAPQNTMWVANEHDWEDFVKDYILNGREKGVKGAGGAGRRFFAVEMRLRRE